MRFLFTLLCFAAAWASPAGAQCPPLEVAKVLDPNAGFDAGLGTAVVAQGDLAAVGGPGVDGGEGRAWVLGRDVGGAGSWGIVTQLAPPGLGSYLFGAALALSGDTLAVGAPYGCCPSAPGQVYVYERDLGGPDAWGLAVVLDPPAPVAGAEFGASLALDGDALAIGAPGTDQVHVHGRDGSGSWGLVQTLTAGDAGSDFGRAVALEGGRLVAGAPLAVGSIPNAGAAWVFDFGASWTESAMLFATPGYFGGRFGEALALDGDTVAVGSPSEDHTNKVDAGAVYVFERNAGGDGAWGNVARVTLMGNGGPIPKAGDELGLALALSDGHLLAGAPGRVTGQVFRFDRDAGGPGAWQLAAPHSKLKPSDGVLGDAFGRALALDGDRVLIGAPGHEQVWLDEGAAYVFEGLENQPPLAYCTAGTSASGCAPTLSAAGTPSASAASGFVVTASGVEGAKDGLFFFGTNGQQASPWGTGGSYQCVVPPVVRGGLLAGSGASGTCGGGFSQDLTALWWVKPAKHPGPGADVSLQLWYRDPLNTGNQTTSLSGGLSFVVCP